MLRDLWRSTPFRLIASLSGAFLIFLVVVGLVALALIRAELEDLTQRQLEQRFAIIARSYGENDLDDLIEAVRGNVAANSGTEQVFLLLSAEGSILAGNIAMAPRTMGLSVATPAQLGLGVNDANYQTFTGMVGDNLLLVGESVEETDEISMIVLDSLLIAGSLLIVLIGIAGAILSRQGKRRIDRIAQTMTRIGRGELEARIPVTRQRDDLDHLSSQINQALERLGKLVEGMRQVSVNIAHDLKTPLNRLSFTVHNAIELEAKGEPVNDLLLQAQNESRQINATFDALLRIAQIEAGARRARFREVDLEEVLQNLWDAYAEVAEESGQHLTLERNQTPPIFGDRDLLTQLFANLIENAIRHCPAGTNISMAASLTGERLSVIVADDGPGIPEAEREKVFQRLYRLDTSRTTAGNGLGLSLVKAIVELHHATIAISDNAPGLRITIAFELPDAGRSVLRLP